MNTTSPTQPAYRTLDSAAYWAYYLNQATSNLFSIFNDTARRLQPFDPSIEPTTTDARLHKHPVFKPDLEPKVESLRWRLLSDHLPVLKTFQYENPHLIQRNGKIVQKVTLNRTPAASYSIPVEFEKLLYFLAHVRNYFTHYYPSPKADCYSKFKARAQSTGHAFDFDFESVLRPIWNKGLVGCVERYGYKFRRYSWLIRVDGKTFHHDFIEDNELKINGLAYFIGLFLEREMVFELLKQLEYFRTDATDIFRAQRQQAKFATYTAHCCKLPQPMLEIGLHRPRLKLLSDILSELTKCPLELHRRLTDDDRAKLAYQIRPDRIGNIEVNLAEQGNEVDFNALQTTVDPIRKRDKFADLALRFSEQLNLFPQLRFQIHLGRVILYHRFTNSAYFHRWFKAVRPFGRLTYFEELQAEAARVQEKAALIEMQAGSQERWEAALGQVEELRSQVDDARAAASLNKAEKELLAQLKYYEQFSPDYHISNYSVQFIFTDEADDLPRVVETKPDEKTFSKASLEAQEQPRPYRIDLRDLMVLIFLRLADPTFDLRAHLEKLTQNYEQFLEAAATGKFTAETAAAFAKELQNYKLKPSQIPKEVRRCLSQRRLDYARQIEERRQQILDETTTRLKNLQAGKAPKTGNMAVYLTHDIIKELLPKSEHKKAISSEDYEELKEGLAYFVLRKRQVRKIIEKKIQKRKLGENEKHPFLDNVMRDFRMFFQTEDFYRKYLEYKIDFLRNRDVIRRLALENFDQYPFLNLPYEERAGRKEPKTYDLAYLKRYRRNWLDSKTPFILPRGLFNELVDQKLDLKNERPANFIYTILQSTTDRQNFYGFKRRVRINTDDGLKIDTPAALWKWHEEWKKDSSNKVDEKNAWRNYFDDEKRIRLYQAQDLVLLKIAKYLATRLEEHLVIDTTNWTLERLRYKTEANSDVQNIMDENIQIGFKVNQTLVKATTSLKQYGIINLFFENKRVREVTKTLTDREINLEDLVGCVQALNEYGQREAFKYVQALEKACFAIGFKPEVENDYYTHWKYLDFLIAQEHLDNETKKLMVSFRNSFCHSGFVLEGGFQLNEVLKAIRDLGQKYQTLAKDLVEVSP